jgi:HD-GYP domain-containing protein (c-di-GMP phosphodiesterase class II)
MVDEPLIDEPSEDGVEPSHDEEILASQERLGQALDKARAGDDRALATAVREDGERFVRVLYGLLRMLRLHDLENEAFSKPISEFVEITRTLSKLLGAVNVVTVEEQVYVSDIRIRFDERAESGRMMGAELMRHRIGGITIHQELTEENVRAMVEVFAQEPHETAPRTAIASALAKRGVDGVELFGVFRFRVTGEDHVEGSGGDDRQTEEQVVVIVDRGADLVEDSLDNLGANRMPNPLPLRRVVTEIIDGGVGAEGLWDEPGGSSDFGSHVVRVSRFSLVIGVAMGLSEEALQDLGVAALFHDMGYGAREGAVAATDDQEALAGYAPPFERHATAGARLLLRQRGFHPAKIQRILATLEHHDDFKSDMGKPSLFGRILRIAEDFDTLIRSHGGGLTSGEALARMIPHGGTRYDPELLQVFVNSMGKYPPGTMMLLADGSIAVSIGICRSEESFDKPVVRIVRDAAGDVPEDDVVIDLAEGGEVRLVLNSRPESLKRQ